jgi:membrane-associated phospholipid phosphatase
LLLTALYGAIDVLNEFGAVPTHDAGIMRVDQALFGGQISREWWLNHPSRFWSTVLHGSYFAYYPIVVLPVLYFLASGRVVACRRSVLWMMVTFLTCYLVFLFFPVAGPYYQLPRPSALMLDNPMARLVYATLARGSSYGAAFPSSHVAAALVATAAAFLGSRRVGWMLIGPAIMLCVGVVYCQMHYAADALAGLGLAGLIVAGGAEYEMKEKGLRTEGETARSPVLSPQSSVLPTEP